MKIKSITHVHHDKPIPVYDVINVTPYHNFIVQGNQSAYALHNCVVFDEVNFGNAGVKDILKAKKVMKEKYDTLVARVTGTFVKNGEVYGKIYVISSKNEDSDFMEEYVAKQREAGNEHMYVFDKPQWEVWPASKYSSDRKFKIALGGKHLRSFVVPDEQNTPEGCAELEQAGYRLLDVPEDNKTRFLSDFDVALRDIAGITVQGSFSYITQEFLDKVIGERKNPFYHDIIEVGTQDNHTIEEFFHLECVDSRLLRMPMFIHLDMSLTTDRTGISGIVISGRKDIDIEGKTMSMPTYSHVFSIAVQAPRGDKIAYLKINQFICWLRTTARANILCVSRDQFQSEYMAQLLESQGFNTAKVSLDTKPDGYSSLRSIILEQRIDLLHVPLLETELTHLKRDPNTDICDHPVGGCFTEDTLIQLADGSKMTISELYHRAKYFRYEVYTVNEETHEVEIKPIRKVFWTKRVKSVYQVTFNNGEVVQCTPDHLFMLEDYRFVEVEKISVGTRLRALDGKHVIVKAERIHKDCFVYDLEIKDNHNFLLGAGVFVHNSKDVSDSVAGAVWEATLQNPGVPVSVEAKAKAFAAANGPKDMRKSILDRFGTYKKY